LQRRGRIRGRDVGGSTEPGVDRIPSTHLRAELRKRMKQWLDGAGADCLDAEMFARNEG